MPRKFWGEYITYWVRQIPAVQFVAMYTVQIEDKDELTTRLKSSVPSNSAKCNCCHTLKLKGSAGQLTTLRFSTNNN